MRSETLSSVLAEAGKNIVVMIDDAYFGLVYEDGIYKESVFLTADAHPGILAVKIDGATKEDYAWGLRVGFLTYGFKGATPEAFKALEDKSAGAVRGNISNSSHLSQSLLLKTYEASEFQNWKAEKYETMAKRYQEVLAQFEAHPEALRLLNHSHSTPDTLCVFDRFMSMPKRLDSAYSRNTRPD